MTNQMRDRFSQIGTLSVVGVVLMLMAVAQPARLAAQEVHDIYHPAPRDTVPPGPICASSSIALARIA